MSKIAIVGCDASGKTVFVSALTEYYKAGQRIDQTCAMVAADGATRKYTDELHHTMRILHQWPKATPVGTVEGVRNLKWQMIRDGRPVTEIQLLDYGGENFRYAFRDDGTVRNAAVVEVLVKYISEADYIVITVGLDNMVRSLNPELYKEMENGAEEYNRDREAQWITNGLLHLVKPKLSGNPPGVLVALTQADKYKDLLQEYGGAKGLFARCWADIDMMYPNLNVIPVASVDKITAVGLPADDYRTDGVLAVMKEFSRYVFGDCDAVVDRLDALRVRLTDMTEVGSECDYQDTLAQYISAVNELHEKTAMVQELYRKSFLDYDKFLKRARLFNELINEVEKRGPDTQLNPEFWEAQLQTFPDMAGSIRGYSRFYERRFEMRKIEEAKQEEERKVEEALRIEAERKAAEAAELRRKDELAAQERRDKAAREAQLAAEREAQIRKMNAAAEMAKLEVERKARQDRQRFVIILSVFGFIVLIVAGIALGFWLSAENRRKEQATASELALRKAEADKAQAEADRVKAEADKVKAANDQVEREKRKVVSDAMEKLRSLVSADDLEGSRQTISALREMALTENQKVDLEYCVTFCRNLDQAIGGDISNQLWVAWQHANGGSTIDANKRKALEWFEKAGESGSVDAMLMAANWSVSGVYVEKDLDRAKKWYEKAAGKGKVEAMVNLAKLLKNSGSTNDVETAYEWYEKAARGGNVDAMMKLAWRAESTKNIPDHARQAVIWYKKAAEAKCGDALYRLGLFYFQGKMGLPKSYEKARELFVLAKTYGCSHNDRKNGVNAWITACDRMLRPVD